MSGRVTVHKLDVQGREVWAYQGEALVREPHRIVLRALFDREDVMVRELSLRRGDYFVETFYSDRWYNVFAVHDRDSGGLKGWYCNITRPAWFDPSGEHIYADDLALDLVVYPNGAWSVLDEEEFAALALSPHERQMARQALEQLQRRAASRQEPFEALPPDGPLAAP